MMYITIIIFLVLIVAEIYAIYQVIRNSKKSVRRKKLIKSLGDYLLNDGITLSIEKKLFIFAIANKKAFIKQENTNWIIKLFETFKDSNYGLNIVDNELQYYIEEVQNYTDLNLKKWKAIEILSEEKYYKYLNVEPIAYKITWKEYYLASILAVSTFISDLTIKEGNFLNSNISTVILSFALIMLIMFSFIEVQSYKATSVFHQVGIYMILVSILEVLNYKNNITVTIVFAIIAMINIIPILIKKNKKN